MSSSWPSSSISLLESPSVTRRALNAGSLPRSRLDSVNSFVDDVLACSKSCGLALGPEVTSKGGGDDAFAGRVEGPAPAPDVDIQAGLEVDAYRSRGSRKIAWASPC